MKKPKAEYQVITAWRRQAMERKINQHGGELVHINQSKRGKFFALMKKSC